VKVFSKRMLPHQETTTLRLEEPLGEPAQAGGRRGLVDEVEAGLSGLGDEGGMRSQGGRRTRGS
jgi:hypothetical protein